MSDGGIEFNFAANPIFCESTSVVQGRKVHYGGVSTKTSSSHVSKLGSSSLSVCRCLVTVLPLVHKTEKL